MLVHSRQLSGESKLLRVPHEQRRRAALPRASKGLLPRGEHAPLWVAREAKHVVRVLREEALPPPPALTRDAGEHDDGRRRIDRVAIGSEEEVLAAVVTSFVPAPRAPASGHGDTVFTALSPIEP